MGPEQGLLGEKFPTNKKSPEGTGTEGCAKTVEALAKPDLQWIL